MCYQIFYSITVIKYLQTVDASLLSRFFYQ